MSRRHEIEVLWKTYKYEVMWHHQNSYNLIRTTLKGDCNYDEVKALIDQALAIEPTKGSVINALSHMWGYFKKMCRPSEKHLYESLKTHYLLDQVEEDTLILFLYCMAMTYDVQYIKESSIIKNFPKMDDESAS
ncbi:type II DNA modification enzyme [Staphylococcus schleiferi]|nr:type II DNA modification enzyme [Staphylococcus schleiferi]AKS70364.1 type II DNA modification enzyme [Staphylococcus schleiferi]AKS72514.1 type II DNA modification enzyme [Staphylococcus schleiferi]MBT2832736.1 DUF1722 domain-containing protein [Staphylococcus coagulans]